MNIKNNREKGRYTSMYRKPYAELLLGDIFVCSCVFFMSNIGKCRQLTNVSTSIAGHVTYVNSFGYVIMLAGLS